MKYFILPFFTLFISMTAHAQIQCPSEVSDIVQAIEKTQSCSEASRLANACRWGSLADLEISSAAYGKCSTSLGTPSQSDQDLLAKMKKRCEETYKGLQHSLARSANAFCHLNALAWLVEASSPQD